MDRQLNKVCSDRHCQDISIAVDKFFVISFVHHPASIWAAWNFRLALFQNCSTLSGGPDGIKLLFFLQSLSSFIGVYPDRVFFSPQKFHMIDFARQIQRTWAHVEVGDFLRAFYGPQKRIITQDAVCASGRLCTGGTFFFAPLLQSWWSL